MNAEQASNRGTPRSLRGFSRALLVLASLGVCLVYDPILRAAESSPRFQFSLPYSPSESGAPVLAVALEARGEFRFLVDTGSFTSFVAEPVVDRLKLKRLIPGTPDGGPSFSVREIGKVEIVRVQDFRLGGLEGWQFDRVPLTVLPSTYARSLADQKVDGVIGVNFLGKMSVELDPTTKMLSFSIPGKINDDEVAKAGFKPSSRVPLKYSSTQSSFEVTCKLNRTIEEDLGLDTGSKWTVISRKSAEKLRLNALKRDIRVGTVLGSIKHDQAILDSLVVGPRTLAALPVLYPASSQDQDSLAAGTSLGMDVLSRYRILMDFPGGNVYFEERD